MRTYEGFMHTPPGTLNIRCYFRITPWQAHLDAFDANPRSASPHV